jgi:hypothetical protein
LSCLAGEGKEKDEIGKRKKKGDPREWREGVKRERGEKGTDRWGRGGDGKHKHTKMTGGSTTNKARGTL